MQDFFTNIQSIINYLLGFFTTITNALTNNVLFQIGIAIFIIFVIIEIILKLLNRNKKGDD